VRLKVQLTIDEENFAEEISQFIWKTCGKLRLLADSSGPEINKIIRDDEDYNTALVSISKLRERLCSLDIVLEDVTAMIEGYLDYKNPNQGKQIDDQL
jgi:hypothetical protein